MPLCRLVSLTFELGVNLVISTVLVGSYIPREKSQLESYLRNRKASSFALKALVRVLSRSRSALSALGP